MGSLEVADVCHFVLEPLDHLLVVGSRGKLLGDAVGEGVELNPTGAVEGWEGALDLVLVESESDSFLGEVEGLVVHLVPVDSPDTRLGFIDLSLLMARPSMKPSRILEKIILQPSRLMLMSLCLRTPLRMRQPLVSWHWCSLGTKMASVRTMGSFDLRSLISSVLPLTRHHGPVPTC